MRQTTLDALEPTWRGIRFTTWCFHVKYERKKKKTHCDFKFAFFGLNPEGWEWCVGGYYASQAPRMRCLGAYGQRKVKRTWSLLRTTANMLLEVPASRYGIVLWCFNPWSTTALDWAAMKPQQAYTSQISLGFHLRSPNLPSTQRTMLEFCHVTRQGSLQREPPGKPFCHMRPCTKKIGSTNHIPFRR